MGSIHWWYCPAPKEQEAQKEGGRGIEEGRGGQGEGETEERGSSQESFYQTSQTGRGEKSESASKSSNYGVDYGGTANGNNR